MFFRKGCFSPRIWRMVLFLFRVVDIATLSLCFYVYNKYPSPSVYQLRKSWSSIKPEPQAWVLCRGFFQLINARARDLSYLWYLQDISLWVMTFCSDVFLLTCALQVLATAVLVPVVRACNHRNYLSDLFPPALILIRQLADGLGTISFSISNSFWY